MEGRVLVTGSTGFVGSAVVSALTASGRAVRGLARSPGARLPEGVEQASGDLTRPGSLGSALEGVETVVHAAAITGNLPEPYPGAYRDVNAVGTANLVAAARSAGVRRLVVVSGLGTTLGAPGSYMRTRWDLEEAVRGSGIEHVILQPSVLFGRGAPFVRELAKVARWAPVMPAIGGLDLTFQPLWVEDLARCIRLAVEGEGPRGALAIGGPEVIQQGELLRLIARAAGHRRAAVPLPLPIARLQARLMAILPNPPLTPAALELFAFPNATDPEAVHRAYGFEPSSIRTYLTAHGVD